MQFLAFWLGLAIVIVTVFSAIRTFVLPRSANDSITRYVFRFLRTVFDKTARLTSTYEQRDQIMAYYVPVTLLILEVVWLFLIMLGYTLLFYAFGVESWETAFINSGSSLFTLGFASLTGIGNTSLAFSEAILGLIMVALLISYLPTMYNAFSRREVAVAMLEVRAGSPPSAVEMLTRYHRLRRLDYLNPLWTEWEIWFVEQAESHTTFAALSFFRSPQPQHSWVTAAGAVLDAASLLNAVVDFPHDPQADLCLRGGYLALRRIVDYFRLPYNPNPRPDDPISISRGEFDDACQQLAQAGIKLKEDRDQAWRDFAGWRVNYDVPLIILAGLTMAPQAPWSSDRSLLSNPRPGKGFLAGKKHKYKSSSQGKV